MKDHEKAYQKALEGIAKAEQLTEITLNILLEIERLKNTVLELGFLPDNHDKH